MIEHRNARTAPHAKGPQTKSAVASAITLRCTCSCTSYLPSRPGPSTSAALRVHSCIASFLRQQLSQLGAAAELVQAMPKTPSPVLSDEEIQAAATFVVKRFRKFHKHSTESQTPHQQSQSPSSAVAPLLRSTAKAPGLPVPPHCNPDLPLRISDPPIALQGKGIGKHAIRMPSFAQGGPQPPPQQAKCDFVRPPTGGRPCPQPRPTPRSLLFQSNAPQAQQSPREPIYHEWTYRETFADPNPHPQYTHHLSLPRKAQVVVPTTSQLQGQARMGRCLHKFMQCIHTLGDHSVLFQTLQGSKAPEEHARRMLTRFSPSTLEKYLSCIATFLDFRQSDEDLTQGDLTVQGIADYLLSCQRSAVQDRAPHRVSPLTSLKALRWFAKLTEWQELAECTASPLVASYGHSTTCKDKRESYPVPLALVVSFERCVCDVSTAPSMALFLGAVLLCIHGSIRFGDAQRMPWDALQLSATALHGTCDQTKTTKQGQPFAVTLHGISGRNTSSSWVLHWLGHLARYIRTAKLAPTARPDFAFINCHLAEHSIADAAPASYARTLLHLRWVAQNTALLGSHALQAHEAAELTLHSMKSTMLANAAQIMIAKEHRMQQGHHRDSALLYSRNDTFSSLHVQRTVAEAVAKGFRPERSMARGAQAPLPEPPFSVSEIVPAKQIPHSDLRAGAWAIFTSRHETLHSQACTEDAPHGSVQPSERPPDKPSTEQDGGSDSEADAVSHWAQHHQSSDSDTAEASTAEDVCLQRTLVSIAQSNR